MFYDTDLKMENDMLQDFVTSICKIVIAGLTLKSTKLSRLKHRPMTSLGSVQQIHSTGS